MFCTEFADTRIAYLHLCLHHIFIFFLYLFYRHKDAANLQYIHFYKSQYQGTAKTSIFNICFQLELKKMLLDRMVNLLSRGCVVPVLRYVKQCWQRGDTDISLIRYFITEVNDMKYRRQLMQKKYS